MLKLRSGVGAAITVLILLAVGVSLWLRRPSTSTVLEDALNATPPPVPDTAYVGEEIVPPIPAPEFELLDQSGETVTDADLKGRIVLLSFAYTSCPDTCPVLFGRFLSVEEEFEAAIGEDLDLVFLSVDPEVDTPERLKLHTELMGGSWIFLTEELPVMEDVWYDYNIRVEKEGDLVGHSNLTYLMDDQGLIRVRYVGLPPESVFVSDIRKLLSEG
jgi:protein SCO1/2